MPANSTAKDPTRAIAVTWGKTSSEDRQPRKVAAE